VTSCDATYFYLYERLKSEDLACQLSLTSPGNRLQTPILIGCKFLMILTTRKAAYRHPAFAVRCNQRSLKLYTGFFSTVK
jgi:hypothetical protein